MRAPAFVRMRDGRKTMTRLESPRSKSHESPKATFPMFAVASVLSASLLCGCMESSSGESQTQGSAPARTYTANQSSNPACAPSTHLLILDEDAIRNDCRDAEERGRCKPGSRDSRKRSAFEKKDPNCQFSEIGYRGVVPYFAAHPGEELLIPAGTAEDEGWFAPTSIRFAWKNAGPEIGDGFRNYVEAGPGLGSRDAKGDRESLLRNIPNLVPLRATGLARLEGRPVCAVVLDGDVKLNRNSQSGNIEGPNLGKVAFQVLSVSKAARSGKSELPSVLVRILDAEAVCGEPLAPFLQAALPSAGGNGDVDRPACVQRNNLVAESWDRFDTTVWRADGDQAIIDGRLFAKEGARSTAADWISPCPVRLDSLETIRFSNRLWLSRPGEKDIAESGALFFVNADPEGGFENFVFVNVGYTLNPGKVFVELFGRNGGVDFDQIEETSLDFRPDRLFNVDLMILPNAYQISVGGEMVDTVALNAPISAIGLFEVGVQSNPEGLIGSVDSTSIAAMCEKEIVKRCRKNPSFKPQRRSRLGERCQTRNTHVRMARERIKGCAKPSMGLRALAQMRLKPEFD